MMPTPGEAIPHASAPIFEPRVLLAEISASFEEEAGAKGLQLHSLVYGSVPPWVRGDAARLRQVLAYLMRNALRFTESGQVVTSITKDSETRDSVVLRFAVSDTGTGIAPEVQANLFHTFTAPNRRGASGLTLARQGVERLGGGIGVESAPGRGSTFYFSGTFVNCTPPEYAALNRGEVAERPLRVLVAEDEPVNQRVTLNHLAHLGIQADLAEDGEAALRLWEQNPYDIVLMDCYMPRMDGFDAAVEIRRRELGLRHTIIIALTTDARRDKCLAFGMDEYLQKPVKRHALTARLRFWNLERCASPQLAPRSAAGRRPVVLSEDELNSQLMATFLKDAPARLSKMALALQQRDFRAVERDAHTLKSSSALVGADGLSRLCEALEDLSEWGEAAHDPAASLLGQVNAEFERVRPSMQLWTAQSPAEAAA